jgi:hypothetical protein
MGVDLRLVIREPGDCAFAGLPPARIHLTEPIWRSVTEMFKKNLSILCKFCCHQISMFLS